MRGKISFQTLALLAIVCWSGNASAQKGEKPSSQKQEEIDKLIGQLKSDKFKEREQAMRRLMERDKALDALREAAKSDDAEVRRRARKAIEAINKRLAKRALRRAVVLLKKGQTDQFVEQAVRWREYVDEDCWKAAVDHIEAIAAKASKVSGGQFKLTRKLHGPLFTLPWLDVTKLTFHHGGHLKLPGRSPSDQWPLITDERIVAESIAAPKGFARNAFLISDGPIEIKNQIAWSALFANGNIKGGAQIGCCIIVCDGDVTAAGGGVSDSVILAKGNVSVGAEIANSVIISGGKVKLALKFPGASAKNSVIQERQHEPLNFFNFIHFFDPAEVGIEVKRAKEGVWVEALAAAKSFAKGGVRKGDQILAVDGVKLHSTEAFRRLLRRRMQESKPIILSLRRKKKTLHIVVRVSADTP